MACRVHRALVAAALIAAVLITAVLTGSCADRDSDDSETAVRSDADTAAGSHVQVLMLGRSVMHGWFQHWGWQGEDTVRRDGFELTYRELDVPPDIARSASRFIGEAPADSVVFFKFCFDDFTGDENADRDLRDMERWVRQVVEDAQSRDMKVVVGNALPKVRAASSPELTDQHRAFNDWLADYVEGLGSDSVRVFDFYSVLAGSDGALLSRYATSADDSHPNDAAYEELDEGLFDLLDELSR